MPENRQIEILDPRHAIWLQTRVGELGYRNAGVLRRIHRPRPPTKRPKPTIPIYNISEPYFNPFHANKYSLGSSHSQLWYEYKKVAKLAILVLTILCGGGLWREG